MASPAVKRKWLVDQFDSTWPICLEIAGDADCKSPIWVWGDMVLARRVCRLLNQDQMTKSERHEHIKSIYPKACEGDSEALAELARVMRRYHHKTKCFVCGQPIHTEKRPGQDARCQPHRKSNHCMKKTKELEG